MGEVDGFGRFGVLEVTDEGVLCHAHGRWFRHLGLRVYQGARDHRRGIPVGDETTLASGVPGTDRRADLREAGSGEPNTTERPRCTTMRRSKTWSWPSTRE